jgi:hypothetical protein
MTIKRVAVAAISAVLLSGQVEADGFRTITDKDSFVSLVEGRQLTRLGIRLDVSPAGQITGKAFGRDVTGAWDWNGGFFCRDLYYGSQYLGPNCQLVQVNGSTMRFIADRGAGQSADLNLR